MNIQTWISFQALALLHQLWPYEQLFLETRWHWPDVSDKTIDQRNALTVTRLFQNFRITNFQVFLAIRSILQISVHSMMKPHILVGAVADAFLSMVIPMA